MAIPLSDEMKQIRGPKMADIKPMDQQRFLQGMGEAALAQNRNMQQGIRGGMQFAQNTMDMFDAQNRNKIEREYNERTAELNEQLEEKELEERQKFQPKYEAEMKKALDKYESSINRLGNAEIREGSKRSISAWNQRNASNYQYGNWKNDTDVMEKDMGQALITDNRKRILAINPSDNATSLYMYSQDPELGFSHGAQMLRDFYGGRKGMPKEVVEEYVNDYVTKGSIAMANRLVQVTREYTGNAAYGPAINYLKQMMQSGSIDPKEAIKAVRDFQKEQLALNVNHNPGWFIGADGKFNPVGRGKFAPDLTQYEYEYFLKQSLGSYKPGQSGAGAVVTMAIRTELDRYVKDWKANHGDYDDDSVEAYIKMRSLKDGEAISKEDALKELQANIPEDKKSPMELINFGKTLQQMQAMWVLVDNEKGFAIGKSDSSPKEADDMLGTSGAPKMTLEQMQKEFAKDPNRYSLFQPLADYQPLAEERAINENKFRIAKEAFKKEDVFRDPGKAINRKDDEGFYRTNNQERGAAILTYLSDAIPIASSQFGDIIQRYTELLPQEIPSGETRVGPDGQMQNAMLGPISPYGFVSDDNQTSREVITLKLLQAMNGVLTNQQIQAAKQLLDSRPFLQHVWTPGNDMVNEAYSYDAVPKKLLYSMPMPDSGITPHGYSKDLARAAALQKGLKGYQTAQQKLYNKTYQAQDATIRWADEQVEKHAANGGYSAEELRAIANGLEVQKKQANRRKR